MKYSISVGATKSPAWAKNVFITNEMGDKFCLGVYANSGDIKLSPCWGTTVGPTLAAALVAIKPKLSIGYSCALEISVSSSGIKWKLSDEMVTANTASVIEKTPPTKEEIEATMSAAREEMRQRRLSKKAS